MKLVLHIGTPKTGTTSIQNFFSKCSSELQELGILFPVERSVRQNHILFMGGFVREDGFNIPHNNIYMGSFKRYKSDFEMFWCSVVRCANKSSVNTVIISAEQLFRDFNGLSAVELKDFVFKYFDSVQVVAYVRSPVSDYTSKIAQKIRVGREFSYPRSRSLRKVLEYYESQFPGCVNVNAFARDQLLGGDVVEDFVSRYVPEARGLLVRYNQPFYNTSLPEPLLIKMQDVRIQLQSDGVYPTVKTRALVESIAHQYMCLPKAQRSQKNLVLKPEVADFLRRSAVDYRWLLDTYGLRFSDLDYSQIAEIENPYVSAKHLRDVVEVDVEQSAKLHDFGLPASALRRGWIVVRFVTRMQAGRIYRLYLRDSWLLKTRRKYFSGRVLSA